MKFKLHHKILLSSVALCTSYLNVNAETIEEAAMAAIQNHPEIKVAQNNQAAIKHLWRQAKSGYYPTLDFTAGVGHERTNSPTTRGRAARDPNSNNSPGHRSLTRWESSLSATQVLFDGFKTSSQVCQQRERFNSARYNVMEITENIALRATEAYIEVLRNSEILQVFKANLDTHTQYLAQIKARATGGRGSKADVRQAEGRLALISANYKTAQGDLANAKANYLEVVGKLPEGIKRSKTPVASLPANIDAAIARAMENNFAISSAKHDIKASQSAREEAKSSFYPTLNIELDASRNHNIDGQGQPNSDNNDYLAMVRMRYNLYNGGADLARKREQTSKVAEAQEQLERDRRLVEENMYNAWNNLDTSRARIEPLSRHVTASDQTRIAYKQQFDIGQRSLLDLLDSEIEYFTARIALTNAKYALDFSVYDVLAQAGDLVETLKTTN